MAGRRKSMAKGKARTDPVKEVLLSRPEDRTEEDIRLLVQNTADNKFFNSQMGDVHKECCKSLTLMTIHNEDVLFNQGDEGDTFYIVYKGPVNVIVHGNKVATLHEGAAFGELSLIRGEPRAAGIVGAADNTELMVIAKNDYDRILKGDATTQMELRVDFFAKQDMFAGLTREVIANDTTTIKSRELKPGKLVCKEGQPSDIVNFVIKGKCKVTWSRSAIKQFEEQGVAPPQYFTQNDVMGGEDALGDRPFSFTAVTVGPGPCELYYCPKGDYLRLATKIEDEDMKRKLKMQVAELKQDSQSEYFQILALVNFLKQPVGTATVISLSRLSEMDFTKLNNQICFSDLKGLDELLKVIKFGGDKLMKGALDLCVDLTLHPVLRLSLAEMPGALETIVKIITLPHVGMDVKASAAETIAHMAVNPRNRLMIRTIGGLAALISQLISKTPPSPDLIKCICNALAGCAKNDRNRSMIQGYGVIPFLVELLKDSRDGDTVSTDEKLPLIMLLKELMLDPEARRQLREMDAFRELVQLLNTDNRKLLMSAIETLYRAALSDNETRAAIGNVQGMGKLLSVLNSPNADPSIIKIAVSTITECGRLAENTKAINEEMGIDKLVNLLRGTDVGGDEAVMIQVNAAGALWSCLEVSEASRRTLRSAEGLNVIIQLLKRPTNFPLLINLSGLLWACALDPDNRKIIADKQHDGLRLLWSLLKCKDDKVRANAAGALSILLDTPQNLNYMGQTLMGGIPVLLDLLRCDLKEVQSNACAMVGVVSKSQNVLAVMTENGLLRLVAKLTVTPYDIVRKQVAFAVAHCCSYADNKAIFGQQKVVSADGHTMSAVAALVPYLKSQDIEVLRMTAVAMMHLSEDHDNAATMREAGAVEPLVDLMGRGDELLTYAAAGACAHIRYSYWHKISHRQQEQVKDWLTDAQLTFTELDAGRSTIVSVPGSRR